MVIGQAAVQANIVSAMMVIIVSVTALASFTAPSYAFNFPLRLIRIFSHMISPYKPNIADKIIEKIRMSLSGKLNA